MKNSISFVPLFALLLITLTGCSTGRYAFKNDYTPTDIPPLAHLEDVNPHYEPYSRGGNKDYRVRGIDYKVDRHVTNFTETGYASWYGNKFHGHLTSNGERYNMFAMSAAHKNLPLPSYVEVTNLSNNKKVIVRVNDRGPFHKGRIIDLSYAAAQKIGVLKHGTAKVSIKLLHFFAPSKKSSKKTQSTQAYYIQYLVTSSLKRATVLSLSMNQQYKEKSDFKKSNKHYKLRLGPIKSQVKARKILTELQKVYKKAFIIYPAK